MHTTTYPDGSRSFHDAGLNIRYHEDGTPRGASLTLLPSMDAIPLDQAVPDPEPNDPNPRDYRAALDRQTEWMDRLFPPPVIETEPDESPRNAMSPRRRRKRAEDYNPLKEMFA